MRSIFGKCIAMAMMAAIALVWQSPPVQATELSDARDARSDARTDARASSRAADAAKRAAEDAEAAAVAAEDAADAAEAAARRVEDAEGSSVKDIDDARDAADAAREAANDARERAGYEKVDGDATPPIVAANVADAGDDDAWGQYKESLERAGTEKYRETVEGVMAIGIIAEGSLPTDVDFGDVIPHGTDAAANRGTTNTDAWSQYREAQFQYEEQLGNETDDDDDTSADAMLAKDAAEAADTARTNAETAADNAREHARFADTRAAFAQRQAVAATAIAKTATAAAVVAAQKDYDDDPDSFANFRALEDAKEEADEAATAAEDAAKEYADATGDDDDDDTTMAGEDDDDDDGDMMPMVTANGVGNLLKFGFWTTTYDRDTLLAVTNPGYDPADVTVKIVNNMGGSDTFTICLTKGDVWTARLMSDGEGKSMLDVVNPGTCDSDSDMPTVDMLPLAADHGFIEAYTTDGMIMGIANIVSAMGGFSSIYNAVSIVDFDPMSETKMADIQYALAMEGDIRKDMLIGRWAATPSNGARTHVVLTFPAGGGPTTPVRIHVTDQDGLSGSRDFMLDKAVNLCTFMTTDGATTLSCNAGSELPLSSMGGWFKIMAPDMMGFPVIGMVSTVYDGSNGNFDQTAPIQWMEKMDMDDMDDMGMDADG